MEEIHAKCINLNLVILTVSHICPCTGSEMLEGAAGEVMVPLKREKTVDRLGNWFPLDIL